MNKLQQRLVTILENMDAPVSAAEICGVDSEWIRKQIHKAGLCLHSEVANAV